MRMFDDIDVGWKLREIDAEIKEIMRYHEARARMGTGKENSTRTLYKRLYARAVSVFTQNRAHVAYGARA